MYDWGRGHGLDSVLACFISPPFAVLKPRANGILASSPHTSNRSNETVPKIHHRHGRCDGAVLH